MDSTANRLTGKRHISVVLLDITGVLYESEDGGGKAIKESPESVLRLRHAGYTVKFCTNETRATPKTLCGKLNRLGFDIKEEEIYSPIPACCQFLKEQSLRPYLLVDPVVLPDFDGIDTSNPNAVVLGDAFDAFTYENLNSAFRVLIHQPAAPLISLGKGRYYKEGDDLTLDVGPYMKALEYAADVEAHIIGKPSKEFFLSAIKQMDVPADEVIMIGDDLVNDVGGAQDCGFFGVLVRTGKYRPEDETHPSVKPDRIVDNLAQAVELLTAIV